MGPVDVSNVSRSDEAVDETVGTVRYDDGTGGRGSEVNGKLSGAGNVTSFPESTAVFASSLSSGYNSDKSGLS